MPSDQAAAVSGGRSMRHGSTLPAVTDVETPHALQNASEGEGNSAALLAARKRNDALACAVSVERVPAEKSANGFSTEESQSVVKRSRTGIDFAAGTLLCSAWCASGISGLHSG